MVSWLKQLGAGPTSFSMGPTSDDVAGSSPRGVPKTASKVQSVFTNALVDSNAVLVEIAPVQLTASCPSNA